MTRRVYKGIPESVRGLAWRLILDLPKIRKEQVGIYEVSASQENHWEFSYTALIMFNEN